MLSQLMVLFGFFSLVLVMVYWINRAVVLFDQLIANGQSASVFLEFTALSLPAVIKLALPLSAFAASIYVTNRMTSESEMVAVQATGYSSFRIARPVLYFGLIVMVLMSALTHFLMPLSTARLDERRVEISQNMTARLLTEGKFIEPIDGVTFYIREISTEGELRDIFLSDNRNADSQVTYTADTAYLVKTDDAAQLVMINGLAQTLNTRTNRLFTTTFKDFAYNIGGFLQVTAREGRRAAELSTTELLRADAALQAETGESYGQLIARAHDRFAQSFMSVVAALLGFATLMVGGFSRFGVWRQIVAAIFLIIVIKATETLCLNITRENPSFWIAAYFPTALGLAMAWGLLFWSTRPYLFKRQPKLEVTA
ncbi:MAG: LPS export ABC transporter permease LptF [Loktanella sp.]|jgi:lipopolysaccharide export system permease protein|nr:LPS export ABC transporter permease LptF [Loktanella sp.]MDO7608586.1 LPS export ABC transporter permease LptF [Loktanella sp.]MDO7623544.1 LPS export ABC transporter permease LptF [Loktanella sp.]MDO7627026.1 LPS export ABC transporter permease LptF [Loktanella sp.]MDO7665643.1 LPS export ABC transporter permease LptF [Loktanella sp.]